MSRTANDARQVILRKFLEQIGNRTHHDGTSDAKAAGVSELDNLLDSIDLDLKQPLRLDASNPADLVVSVGPSVVANTESGRNKSITHIGGVLPDLTSGTITFPATSGNTITVSPGNNNTLTVTSNNYIKVLVYMDSNGNLNVSLGVENATEANATVPAAPNNTLAIGYVTLFNNAGTIDNIAQSKIYQFGSGGGASSSGQGRINYILNPDAEVNTDGWVTYNDGAVSAPIDGVGGSADLQFGQLTSNQIRGNGSFVIGNNSLNKQGQGVAYDFDIDPADKGKRLPISFDYRVFNTNYNSGDIKLFVYDKTNATMLNVDNDDGGDILDNFSSAGLSDKFVASFNAASDSTSYRLIYHITSTNAFDWDVIFDNVFVGPDPIVPGAIITELGSIGFTIASETNATASDYCWRDGNLLKGYVQAEYTGAPTGAIKFQLPAGYVIDSSKLADSASFVQEVGSCTILDGGLQREGTIVFESTSLLRPLIVTTATGALGNLNAGNGMSSGDKVAGFFEVPIEGWSTGASLSTTENLFSSAKLEAGIVSFTGAIFGTSSVKVPWDDIRVDNLNQYNTSTDEYKIPRNALYTINGTIAPSGASAGQVTTEIYVNNVLQYLVENETTGSNPFSPFVWTQKLDKDDLVDVRVRHSSDASWDMNSNSFFSIVEHPDFSTFSVFGETEYKEVLIESQPTTTLATTWEPVGGTTESITLGPGTWQLGYNLSLYIQNVAAAQATRLGSVRIYDVTNAAGVDLSGRIMYAFLDVTNVGAISASNQLEITITEPTTYALQVENAQGAASATTTIQDRDINPANPGNDNSSRLWARRIK